MSVAITDAITSLAEVERRLNLTRTEDEHFFPEWYTSLPALTDGEKAEAAALRRRYLYQCSEGNLLEAAVILLFASPLLTIAGFYDPPFKVRAEETLQIRLEDSEEVLQGRLDVLVLKDQLWVVILEAKKTALSVWSALPQTLAYMVANPSPDRPSFGFITNGDNSVFVKLVQSDPCPYNVSRVFAALTSNQELDMMLQILKRVGQAIDQV